MSNPKKGKGQQTQGGQGEKSKPAGTQDCDH